MKTLKCITLHLTNKSVDLSKQKFDHNKKYQMMEFVFQSIVVFRKSWLTAISTFPLGKWFNHCTAKWEMWLDRLLKKKRVIVFIFSSPLPTPNNILLKGERVGFMTWWLWVRDLVGANFLYGVFSPLTSAEACKKSSRWLWKEFCVNPFPNKPWFSRVCCTSLLKTLSEKVKLLVTSNFSFLHNVFYPVREL